MPAILGIDAAWTTTHPSGIALLSDDGARWRSVALAPSYAAFIAAADGIPVDWAAKPAPGEPDADCLLDAAAAMLNGARVDVVAVDMPLATIPITGRRAADNEIARKFGARGCAVHSPSAERPGRIADNLRAALARARPRAYPLATTSTPAGTTPALLEVFPHTALLALLGESFRVPYKIAKARKYAKSCRADAVRDVLNQWRRILDALGRVIAGIALPIPADGSAAHLKRYEDALDALLCAWVGIEYLAGRAKAYGDPTAAIWTPSSNR
jgi:predicted RNase H-like nuclease